MALAPAGEAAPPRGVGALVERDADAPVVAPHRAAAANELVGLDQEHERRRQADAAGEVESGAVGRQIADRAGQAVAADYINAGPVSLVTLTIGSEFVVASNVLSGSGAKYAGGQYVWWTKGENATLIDTIKGDNDPGIACSKVE